MLWDISFNCQPFVNWTLARCHVVSFWRSRSWYFESLKVVVILKENTMMKLRKLAEKQTNKQKGSEFPKRNFRLLVCNFFISLIAAHLQTSFCYVDVKTLTSICIASFQSKSNVEEDVVRLVTSVKKKEKKFWVPIRNRTPDHGISCSDARRWNPRIWGSIPRADSEVFLCSTLVRRRKTSFLISSPSSKLTISLFLLTKMMSFVFRLLWALMR